MDNRLLLFAFCFSALSQANYLLLNKTSNYVLFTEYVPGRPSTETNYIIGPGASLPIQTTKNLGQKSRLSVQFLVRIDKKFIEWFTNQRSMKFVDYSPAEIIGHRSNFADEFVIPDDRYAQILIQAREHLPIIEIVRKQILGGAKFNIPQTSQALENEINQIKKEKIAETTQAVSEATKLPTQQGSVSGIIAEYCVEKE